MHALTWRTHRTAPYAKSQCTVAGIVGVQDAFPGSGLDRPREAVAQAEAGPGQGLSQARGRARHPALAGSRIGGRDRRLRLRNAFNEGAYSHRTIRSGAGPKATPVAAFKSTYTTLGNIKSAITGIYRKLGPDHAERHLTSFVWRYNRRATSSRP